ncbi:hypothetical protein [uncultured Corynebacterium sp.]|uniref:hypothetical protein n=1 Tax=uncultured Corynebacterium sp. TaxID=159447 RepID=UPI0028D7945C|nr:hypothetical protein [uncultured Corynebacterium sp.]
MNDYDATGSPFRWRHISVRLAVTWASTSETLTVGLGEYIFEYFGMIVRSRRTNGGEWHRMR